MDVICLFGDFLPNVERIFDSYGDVIITSKELQI